MTLTDYLLAPSDYLCSLTRQERVADFLIPPIIALVVIWVSDWSLHILPPNKVEAFYSSILNLLAILVGFSMACIAVLTSGSSKIMEAFRDRKSERKRGKDKYSFYQIILINFTWAVEVELLLLGANILLLLLSMQGKPKLGSALCIVNVAVLTHVIVVNFRNISNIFFSLWADAPTKEGENT